MKKEHKKFIIYITYHLLIIYFIPFLLIIFLPSRFHPDANLVETLVFYTSGITGSILVAIVGIISSLFGEAKEYIVLTIGFFLKLSLNIFILRLVYLDDPKNKKIYILNFSLMIWAIIFGIFSLVLSQY